jgi:hypothetical protein
MANRPYLVGERGPELFIPQSAGHVMAGGGTVTVRWDAPLPPVPAPLSPDVAASHDYCRRLFSHLKLDYDDRGGL